MTFAPVLNQNNYSPDAPEDCFETCLGAVLQHLGHNVGVETILASHAGGTTLAQGLDLCAQFGLKGCSIDNGEFTNNNLLAICLFRDNDYSNPDSGGKLEHFGVVYEQDAASVSMMNPFDGLQVYPLGEFNPAYLGCILVPVSENTAVAPPAPAPAPPAPAPEPSGITWVSFTVHVQVGEANVRSGPTTTASVLRDLPDGHGLICDGWCRGPAELDPVAHQEDSRWYHISQSSGYGWIASAVVDGNAPNSTPL